MKGAGYAVSIISVLLLGAAAWPKPTEADWKAIAVVAGMIASIIGMALRYLSHRKDRADIAQAQAEASKA